MKDKLTIAFVLALVTWLSWSSYEIVGHVFDNYVEKQRREPHTPKTLYQMIRPDGRICLDPDVDTWACLRGKVRPSQK